MKCIEAVPRRPNQPLSCFSIGTKPTQKRPSAGGRQLLGSSSTEIYHHNAISDSLLTSPWELLLSRIGDTLMLYLLLHVTMFRRLPNGCCLQLSGPPAHEKVRNFRRYRSIPSVLENIAIDQPRKLENLPSEPALKRRKVVSSGFPLTYKTQELSNQNQTHDDGHEIGRTRVGQGEPHRINLKTRPSSWQRRKLYQSKLTANDSTKDENVIPPTQPDVFDSHCANDERHAVCQNAASPKVNAARPQPWPRYLPKFADMYIPRSPVFYSAGYPSKPGFPKKRKC